MNKLQTLIAVAFISFTSAHVFAAPVDEGPPAQTQKNNLPESTEHGDYLEHQPTENSDARQAGDKQASDKQSGDKHNKKANKKPKGKNVTEQPKEGGVDVNQR